ncbi:MAG: biotin transporter BioY [Spirochaetales bacterium]|nr:biotin transporter BioY [Spirochaetales bacterium]
MEKKEIQSIVLTALFTALIIAGSYMALPIGPVPVVLATLFILLAGMLLGPRAGASAVIVYLLLGAVGLPVFSGGKGGAAVLIGPTGGYLLGYFLSALVTGIIVQPAKSHGKVSLVKLILATVTGTVLFFLPGVPWLKFKLAMTWGEALAAGLTPFILGAVIKGTVALILARIFIPRYWKEQE